jgi:glucose/arabinose dehydrogenase
MLAVFAALAGGCGSPSATQAPATAPGSGSVWPTLGSLRLDPALIGIEAPTNFAQSGNDLILVTDQEGVIRVFEEERLGAERVFASEPLDIRDRVSSRGWEEGLLGLALSPKNEGHLYLYYSAANPRRSVVSRFNYNRSAALDSELVILEVEQPYANHNGGQLAFGPDGYLYIGLGDGGSAGDPQGNGQDTSTLLGAILRLDVSESTAEQPYAIPPDNPFADGRNGRPEIWAYGLRNPWRFSFDRETGELWAGDVGQNRWEEIDVIERGGNYGWNAMEGSHCFRPPENCHSDGMIPPVWEYPLEDDACSVIGGYVYRGATIPWLTGVYVYGDFCTGQVFGLRYADGEAVEHKLLADTGLRIASFGQDNDGELYVLSQGKGIFRLVE